MKRIKILLILSLLFMPSHSFAIFGAGDIVHDPINAVIARIRDAAATIHESFMQMQMVQQAKILYDNYVQGKKYYDEVREMSRHEGGFLGYVQDYAGKQFDLVKQEQLQLFEKLKAGDQDNQLSRGLEKYNKKVVERINNFGKYYEEYQEYGEKLNTEAIKRDKEIFETIKKANKSMDEKGAREIQIKLQVHQTQLMADLVALERAKQLMEMKKQQEELRQERESLKTTVESMNYFFERGSEMVTGSRKNPYDELRRRPTE